MRYFLFILLGLLSACTTQQPSSGSGNNYRNGGFIAQPQQIDWPKPVPSLEPLQTFSRPCGAFFRCNVDRVGELRSLPFQPTSAIACGKCDVDGNARGPILAIWCKHPNCENAEIDSARHVWGQISGVAVNGRIVGSGVVLVTKLGAFRGKLNQNGGYDTGLLIKDKLGNGFIGKFNDDGSYAEGVRIQRDKSGGLVLIAGKFLNNRPDGISYVYNNGRYQVKKCRPNDGCKDHQESAGNRSDNKVLKILGILASDLLESHLLVKPLRLLAMAVFPVHAAVIGGVVFAYEIIGGIKTAVNIADVLNN